MSSDKVTLFRNEVVRHRSDRLNGTVSLATPLAWQAVGFLLTIALLVTIIFLSSASYAHVETVSGAVTLDKGVATIVPSRPGVVSAISVSNGQRVKSGQILALIRSEEDMSGGGTAPARARRSLYEQDMQLAAQGISLVSAAGAEQAKLREQIAGASAELRSLSSQIDDQRRLVDLAVADFESLQAVASNGFISKRDMQTRQSLVITRRQQFAQLEQARLSKISGIAEDRRALEQANALAQAQLAGSRSQRAVLTQRLAETDSATGYAITSPVDGMITALTARLGQPANSQQQLMIVVPAEAKPYVELYVPTHAVGFLKPGQPVRLAIDAFHYQHFGTVSASVADISAVTIIRQGSKDPVPVYLVTARVPRPWVTAFGRRHRLTPGMTLTARIVTENHNLLESLFEPLFAVGNR